MTWLPENRRPYASGREAVRRAQKGEAEACALLWINNTSEEIAAMPSSSSLRNEPFLPWHGEDVSRLRAEQQHWTGSMIQDETRHMPNRLRPGRQRLSPLV